jgi:hypothetical protein
VLLESVEGEKYERRIREVPETMSEHCRIEGLAIASGRRGGGSRAWHRIKVIQGRLLHPSNPST